MEFDVESIKRKMLVKYPFFGSVIANVEYIDTAKIETAATDGKKIYFNRDFMNKLSINEQVFIFSHEVCHIAFNHIERGKGKDYQLWNIATDAIINASLKRDGLIVVDGSVDMDEALNFDAEQFYKILLERKENNNKKDDNKFIGSHSLWKKCLEDDNNEISKSFKEQYDRVMKQSKYEKNIREVQKKLGNIGEKEVFKKNREFRKEELEKLKDEISKKSLNHRISSQSNLRNVGKIGKSKPLIDWRYILKETLNYDVDWSYKNAFLEDGVLCANLEEQPIPVTEILLDTSGSVSTKLLKNFLRECKNIMQTSKVKVGCFDTKFYGFKEIKTENDIENMHFFGGGGTDFEIAVQSFTSSAENKIIFTDGEADMPKEQFNVIWIVFGNEKILPIGGKIININEEQLKQLYFYDVNFKSKIKIK